MPLYELFRRFHFLDPGSLVDGELELVAPQLRWVDELLDSCRHPMTVRDAPADACLTRSQLEHFLATSPLGRERADPSRGRPAAYHFWMMLRRGPGSAQSPPLLRIAGAATLRVGHGADVENYYGHLGYHVFPAVRGQRYAERACRLLLPLARRHAIDPLWITCNPDNHASRRTCERLGADLVDTVDVPMNHPLYARGETRKCRYQLGL